MNIAIIGGGAAGYFAAVNIMEMAPSSQVTIYEAASRSLAKVAVSGGGRCNLTNSFEEVADLRQVYPRGAKLMKSIFRTFDHISTQEWFEQRGVELVTQSDQCIFPASQDAQQIVSTLIDLATEFGVTIKHSHRVERIVRREDGGYRLLFRDAKLADREFDCVVVTTGGSPRIDGFDMLRDLDLPIVSPVPSLFSFNIADDPITQLMGTVVDPARVSLRGSRLSASGALLITHWGVSGPAILKLSSHGARELKEREYKAVVAINWLNDRGKEEVLDELHRFITANRAKMVTTLNPFGLTSRLWCELLRRASISDERRYAELGSKGINRLVEVLTGDEYQISGKSTFKEEFVTCGGVSLKAIDYSSMEAKEYPNLYFAGEVLDVDAVTGGFNLQAAWSMAYIVAKAISMG